MSIILDIARWADVQSRGRLFSWVTHGLMAIPLAVVFGPLVPFAVFLYREGEQVLHRYLQDVPRDWLDHVMDVLVPALVGLLWL